MTVYRADHVGSLKRPQAVLKARADSSIPPDRLREIEDAAILDALAKQRELGLRIFTDGEIRRGTFMSDFNSAVAGLDNSPAIRDQWSTSAAPNFGIAVAKVRAIRRMTGAQIEFMKRHSPGDIKMTLPSANQFPVLSYQKGVSDAFYPTYSDFLWDCAAVIRDEVKALADESVAYLQLDAPRYSYYIDPKWREYIHTQMGKDPNEALEEAIRVDNLSFDAIAGRNVVRCIHLCRGNNRSQWYAEGGYDAIAETLFNELNVENFSLEYDTDRAGTFEPLRFVPPGKKVVLGLVTTKTGALESADEIVKRIEAASEYLPIEQLTLSPQCGFASMAEGNVITEEQQWRKLELIVEVARAVWGTA